MINKDSILIATDDLPAVERDGELIVLHSEGDHYCCLAGLGPYMWKLLQQRTTVAGIVDEVLRRFDVSEARCSEDIVRFTSKLVQLGLVRVCRAEELA